MNRLYCRIFIYGHLEGHTLLTFFALRLKFLIIVQSSVVMSIKFNVAINDRIRSSLVEDFS